MPTKNIVLAPEMIEEIEGVASEEDIAFTAAVRHILRVGLLVIQNPNLTGKRARTMARMYSAERKATRYTAQDFFK